MLPIYRYSCLLWEQRFTKHRIKPYQQKQLTAYCYIQGVLWPCTCVQLVDTLMFTPHFTKHIEGQHHQEGTFWKCLGVVWQINWTRKASMQTLQNVILKTIAYYESAAKQWAIPCYYWSWVQFREFCLVILSPTLCILYKRLKMLLESLRLYTNYNRMVGKKSRN